MQTISKVLVSVALACLLLAGVSNAAPPLRHAPQDNRGTRERHRSLPRLRRCRGDKPTHHPVRPCKNAVLPPDDDDNDDQERLLAKGSYERLSALLLEPAHRSFSSPFGSRPLPTEVPRHQVLCILLI